jgi:DNA-binding transcriptional LysR family regulator
MTRGIDLRQLRYFVAVAEELHFGRAAARLGLAQPPLTQQIQRLESLLGHRLLARDSRKSALTEAGAVLLEESRQVLERFDRALEAARRAGRGETGHLTVGTPPSVMLTVLPRIIRRYRARYPDVNFTLREMSTTAIGESIASGAIDLGFLREAPPAESLARELVLREPVLAVLPSAHRLARQPRLALRALAPEPFVLFPRRLGEAFYDQFIGFCRDAGFLPHVIQEGTQWQSIVAMVEAGIGVSLVPACVRRIRWPGVIYRPLTRLSTSVSLCWKKGSPTPPMQTFVALALASFATRSPARSPFQHPLST